MFYYVQSTGEFGVYGLGQSLVPWDTGYAGAPGFVNRSSTDRIVGKGPLPRGVYFPNVVHHPRFAAPAIRLDPWVENQMHGRSAFFIHGDNALGNQSASSGCIVLQRATRERIADAIRDGSHRSLTVVGASSALQILAHGS